MARLRSTLLNSHAKCRDRSSSAAVWALNSLQKKLIMSGKMARWTSWRFLTTCNYLRRVQLQEWDSRTCSSSQAWSVIYSRSRTSSTRATLTDSAPRFKELSKSGALASQSLVRCMRTCFRFWLNRKCTRTTIIWWLMKFLHSLLLVWEPSKFQRRMFSTTWTRILSLSRNSWMRWYQSSLASKTIYLMGLLMKWLQNSLICSMSITNLWESNRQLRFLEVRPSQKTQRSRWATRRFCLPKMSLSLWIFRRFIMILTSGPNLRNSFQIGSTRALRTTSGSRQQMVNQETHWHSLLSTEVRESASVKASLRWRFASQSHYFTTTSTSSLLTRRWCMKNSSTVSVTRSNQFTSWKSSKNKANDAL